MTRWEWLINNAKIEIHEFSVDRWQEFSVQNRRFPFYVMSYIKEGIASAIIEGKEYSTPAGSLILIPANTPHSHFIPEGQGPTTFLWWHFDIVVDGLDLMKLINCPIVLHIQNSMMFENAFYSYMEFDNKKQSLPGLIFRRAKEFEIMALLFENIMNTSPDLYKKVDEISDVFFAILQDIIEHPECNSSLQEISKKYYLNPTYISNRFKKLFGISPIRLHNKVVIRNIKALLTESDSYTIGDLTKKFGFSDVSTFTHFFSSQVGCAPSEYRDRYFENKDRYDS